MADSEVLTSVAFETDSVDGDAVEAHAPMGAVEFERDFAALPGAIYRAWLDPDLFTDWIAPDGFRVLPDSVTIQPEVGGWQRFTIVQRDDPSHTMEVAARFAELDEPRRVVAVRVVDGAFTTTVEVDIEGCPTGTRMHFRQYPCPERTLDRRIARWRQSFDKLERALADRP